MKLGLVGTDTGALTRLFKPDPLRNACETTFERAHRSSGRPAMPEADGPMNDVSSLMHEMAERLQALGNYIDAIGHRDNPGGSDAKWQTEMHCKASSELARTYEAFHQLRRMVNSVSAAARMTWPPQTHTDTPDWRLGITLPKRDQPARKTAE